MNTKIARELAKQQQSIEERLAMARYRTDSGAPELPRDKLTYDLAGRVQAVGHGGLGVVHQLVVQLGLAEARGQVA